MTEYEFHLISGKKLVFALNDPESEYLQSCVDSGAKWFTLADQAVNLDHIVLISLA